MSWGTTVIKGSTSQLEWPDRGRQSHEARPVPQHVMLYVYIPVSLSYPTSNPSFLPFHPLALSPSASKGS